MFNFDKYCKKGIKDHNPNWLELFYQNHLYVFYISI